MGSTSFTHLVARARADQVPLTDDDVAQWLWSHMRRAFPDAFGAVLMSNHLHLVTPALDASVARADLARVVGALARSGAARERVSFEPVPSATLETDASKLPRITRYAALNPVRARLIDDPLLWKWSTHRDVVGAVESPWVTSDRLADALGRPRAGFARWWHRYVAREDLVASAAAVFPTAASLTPFAEHPIQAVARAVASATRTRVSDIRRRGHPRELFLAVAAHVGWCQTKLLAEYCGMSQRSVQEALLRPPGNLTAALLCLGDPRLR